MIIKDKTLEPYEIHISENNYRVEEDTFNKNKDGDTIFRNKGYFSSIESCILKISKLKIETKDVITLKEYIDGIKSFKSSIMKSLSSVK